MSDPLNWYKSSYSGSHGGDCVEVAKTHPSILVRDTQNRPHGYLEFRADEWASFLTAAKTAGL